MVKNNLSAWYIDRQEFSDNWDDVKKLQFFAKYAVLAPSGHNTQPWHFSNSGKYLILKANPSRHLPYSGTAAAEPYVSLGTCLETLTLAGEGFGYKVLATYKFNDEDNIEIHIKLGGSLPAKPSLLTAIVHRISNRYPFDTDSLPVPLLKSLTETDLKSVSTHTISSEVDKSFVAEQTSAATINIMSDPLFRKELSKWVRNNITRKYDGMPGHVQGIPTPPSLVAKHVIKNFNISKDQAKRDSQRVKQSANLVILLVKESSPVGFLEAGRHYARICILAQEQGIASSGVGAAAIDVQARQILIRHFNLKYQPVAIIRLGKTTKRPRHTPRWPLEKVSD